VCRACFRPATEAQWQWERYWDAALRLGASAKAATSSACANFWIELDPRKSLRNTHAAPARLLQWELVALAPLWRHTRCLNSFGAICNADGKVKIHAELCCLLMVGQTRVGRHTRLQHSSG
jgi:hypothetical protein